LTEVYCHVFTFHGPQCGLEIALLTLVAV